MSVVKNDLGEPIQEGYPGNLTPEHKEKLQEFWRRFFQLTERNVQRSEDLEKRGGVKAALSGDELAKQQETKDSKKKKDSDEAKKAGELKSIEEAVNKYGGPYLRKAMFSMCQTDSPDATALRFLRARKYDIDRSLGMCVAALQFRMDMDIDDILWKGEEGLKDEPGFMNQYRRGISYIEGNTSPEKHELPIYFIHVARHFTSAQKAETLQRFVLLAMENARTLTTPPLVKAVIVFDMAGFGLKNMDWGCVMFILKCLEAYYPESLQRIYVHGAPWIFKGIWAALQPLIDPEVQEKIKFSTKASELEEYIPKSRLRKAMGGTLDWEWEYPEPIPGENDLLKEDATRKAIQDEFEELTQDFQQVTMQWTQASGQDDQLDYQREVLDKKLRLKYYQLRPYLRAVSVYQRTKVLRNDGLVTWTYPQTTGQTESQHVCDRHNVPQLIAWLKEHHEDTLEDSVGGQKSPACIAGESYDVTDALKVAPKKTKSNKAAAANTKRDNANANPTQTPSSEQDSDPSPASRTPNEQASDSAAEAGAAGVAAGAGAVGAGAAAGNAATKREPRPRSSRRRNADQAQAANTESSPANQEPSTPRTESSPAQKQPSNAPSEETAAGNSTRRRARKPVPSIANKDKRERRSTSSRAQRSSAVSSRSASEQAESREPADSSNMESYQDKNAEQSASSLGKATAMGTAAVGAVAGAAIGAVGATGAAISNAAPSLSRSGGEPSIRSSSSSAFESADEWVESGGDRGTTQISQDFSTDSDEDQDDLVEDDRPLRTNGLRSGSENATEKGASRRSMLAQEYELDEDEQEQMSDSDTEDDDEDAMSITPDTVLAPDYTRAKVSAQLCHQSEADLRDDLEVAHQAMELFLNSQMHDAEQLCSQGADRRLYRSVGMALINCVKSVMTFEPSDLQIAMQCCRHTMNIADVLRKKPTKLAKFLPLGQAPSFKDRTLEQQHAELVYAEAMMLRAVLGIAYAGGTIGFVRQAMNLRNAYAILRTLLKNLEESDALVEEARVTGKSSVKPMDQDLRSGIYLGNGLAQLILSLLPQRLLGVMEKVGFAGDRRQAMQMFERAGGWSRNRRMPSVPAEQEGVRRSLCDMMILMYHLVISAYVPMTDVDLTLADQVLSWNLQRFPRGIFFLYFSARLYATQALPEKAIDCYRAAIEAQREFKQLHHLCFWSLSLTYLSTSDFDRAYECYDVLSRESNWSKAIYQYAKAAMLYESSAYNRSQSNAIMMTVPKLVKRVAGRHIPFERFVQLKASKFSLMSQLGLPAMEFSYLWHCLEQAPVFLLISHQLTRIDEVIDQLEAYQSPSTYGSGEQEFYSLYCLAFFLRGVALRYVAYPEPQTVVRHPVGERINVAEVAEDAIHSFMKVFEYAHFLDAVDRYLVYFAHYELGCLYSAHGNEADAKRELELVLSRKPLVAQDTKRFRSAQANYLLSGTCQLRANAALETMRINRDRRAERLSKSRSVRRRSSSAARRRSSVISQSNGNEVPNTGLSMQPSLRSANKRSQSQSHRSRANRLVT
ncbi:hypothetical protein MYAM1_000050 [Malassezia yamatoensis]|uniref:CRAL-TRIO domain-containing protein n=1 Tax=Malassezia yamatoensis TaxID=253288 RepID=A0AAJ5YQI9_9BASI|nr:hypothetical protein MYAM1_000050 [Malassezia yamatoensis]